ncbi:hypothetical protein, partial [Nocardiopsis sp. SBT366]|uniref:hypothetical protein n=1 Tax=Nocardiopsis sp. SBT366 TaxID=1580529 RepID=UPI001F1BC01D
GTLRTEVRRGQNKHGLKKIKHALLSSQETITLPVQAPEPKFRLLFRRRLFAFPLLCLYFIRCSAPRQIGGLWQRFR